MTTIPTQFPTVNLNRYAADLTTADPGWAGWVQMSLSVPLPSAGVVWVELANRRNEAAYFGVQTPSTPA